MSKPNEDRKRNSFKQIQQNLQSMKLAASHFLKKTGNSDLPPITKPRHYLFHALNQSDNKNTSLNESISKIFSSDNPQIEQKQSPILTKRKNLSQHKKQKLTIPSICGLQIRQAIQNEIKLQNLNLLQYHHDKSSFASQKDKNASLEKLKLQMRSTKFRKTQKYSIMCNTIDISEMIPAIQSPNSIKKTSFPTKKKSQNDFQEQLLIIKSSRKQKPASSLDQYHIKTNFIEKNYQNSQNLTQKQRIKIAQQPLKDYFNIMKQTLAGSLEFQRDFLKKRKRNSLYNNFSFAKRQSLQLQKGYLKDQKQQNQFKEIEFSPWKQDQYKNLDMILSQQLQ